MFYSNPKSAYDKTWAASDAYFREQKILGKIDALKRYLQTLEERDKSLNGTDARLNSRIKTVRDEIAALEARLEAKETRTTGQTPNQITSKPEPTVQKVPSAVRKPHKTPTPRPLLTLKPDKPNRRKPHRPDNGVAPFCRRNNPFPHNQMLEHNFIPGNDLSNATPKPYGPDFPHHIPQDQRRRHHLAPSPRSDQI